MIKQLLIILLTLLSSNAKAQSTARVFTYDAAGNRIAIGIPQAQAPRNPVNDMGKTEIPVTITTLPDGHVLIQMKTDSGITYSARVYTTAGKIVAILHPTTSPVSVLDLSSLQANVYVVDIVLDDCHVIQKIARE